MLKRLMHQVFNSVLKIYSFETGMKQKTPSGNLPDGVFKINLY